MRFYRIIIILLLISLLFLSNIWRTVASPYGFKESVYWLIKYFIGPSKVNSALVEEIPQDYSFVSDAKPELTIVFAGDIMPTHEAEFQVSSGFKDFLKDADFLIANFEGVITETTKNAPFLISDRRHSKQIINILNDIFPAEKTFLSVANNHSADFGKKEFISSVKLLQSQGFSAFGYAGSPFIELSDGLRIIAASQWLNRGNNFIVKLEKAEQHLAEDRTSILFCHAGYEHELYPRKETIDKFENLLNEFNAIIAHHSHCPQPVSLIDGKLTAFSLGNFLGDFKNRKYQRGKIIKLHFVKKAAEGLIVSEVQWRPIHCIPLKKNQYLISLR